MKPLADHASDSVPKFSCAVFLYQAAPGAPSCGGIEKISPRRAAVHRPAEARAARKKIDHKSQTRPKRKRLTISVAGTKFARQKRPGGL
jgi:hypothetical protein